MTANDPDGPPSGTGEAEDSPDEAAQGPTTGRRSLLKAMTVPALGALAGCPESGVLDSGNGTAGTGTGTETTIAVDNAVPFRETVSLEPSVSMDLSTAGETGPDVSMTGRLSGEDLYVRTVANDVVTETYVVDGDVFQVVDGECTRVPGAVDSVRSSLDETPTAVDDGAEPTAAGTDGERTGESPTETDGAGNGATPEIALRPAGNRTVEGEELSVYELPAGSMRHLESTITYLVEPETGRLRHIEGPFGRVTYSDHGNVAPVEPPDVECREVEPGGEPAISGPSA